MPENQTDQPFAEWCAYSITPDGYGFALRGFGHISEARIAGVEFLKIVDVAGWIAYYAPNQITAIVPDTEQEIRRLALGNPVTLNRLPVSSTQ